MTSLLFRVVGEPVAKARPRASARGGKVRMYTPTKSAQAEWRIREVFLATFPEHEPWVGPVSIRATAYLPMPASIPKKRRALALPIHRPDCDNYLKTILDSLNSVAFRDDSQVVTVTCSKRYALEGPPAWNIELTLLDGAMNDQENAAPYLRTAGSKEA